jgi:inner membrane protein
VYETDDRFYVDAVRTSLAPRVFYGTSVQKLDIQRDMPWLRQDSQQARDIERFRWFSNGYIARSPEFSNRVIDIRYSMLPNAVAPLWSIELDPQAKDNEHVIYQVHRETGTGKTAQLWKMLSAP